MEKIRRYFPRRKNTWSRVPDFTISYNDKSMTIDADHLPIYLTRLLPNGFAVCPITDWLPFCRMADAMGHMK